MSKARDKARRLRLQVASEGGDHLVSQATLLSSESSSTIVQTTANYEDGGLQSRKSAPVEHELPGFRQDLDAESLERLEVSSHQGIERGYPGYIVFIYAIKIFAAIRRRQRRICYEKPLAGK